MAVLREESGVKHRARRLGLDAGEQDTRASSCTSHLARSGEDKLGLAVVEGHKAGELGGGHVDDAALAVREAAEDAHALHQIDVQLPQHAPHVSAASRASRLAPWKRQLDASGPFLVRIVTRSN